MTVAYLNSIDSLQAALADHGYFSERSLATALFLALKLGRPLFLEGEAGVGKTEVAKVLASLLNTRLIRLQCGADRSCNGCSRRHEVFLASLR